MIQSKIYNQKSEIIGPRGALRVCLLLGSGIILAGAFSPPLHAATSAHSDEPRIETRAPKRRGPDLMHQWTLGVWNIGSIDLTGLIEGSDGSSLLVEGRFGPGTLSVDLSADTQAPEWSTHVRLDGLEAEIEDATTGWLMRRTVGDVGLPIAEEADLFGLLPPVGEPQFRSENERWEQCWEYAVRGGNTYRVWLAASPLRMIRRDVIRPGGENLTTFRYRDFFALRPGIVFPREIVAETVDGDRLLVIHASYIATAPPIPRFEPMADSARVLMRDAERIAFDPEFIRVQGRVTAGAAGRESSVLLARLAHLEDSFGAHPFIDLLRARVALAASDDLLAGAAVRAAAGLGRSAFELAARVGALELRATGDTGLMEWALSQALPLSPDALTDAEQRTLERVARSIVEAYESIGDESSALDAARRAAMMSPADRAIARLHVNALLKMGDESAAVKAARWPVTAREEDARPAFELADLLERLSRAPEAEALYRDEMVRQPFEPEWRLRLGRLLLRTNRWVEAEDEFDALIRWMEESSLPATRRAELANAVASALADSNVAIRKAKRLVEFALTVEPDHPFYLDTLGRILLREHNRMAAIRTFERALIRLNDPRIRAHLEAARR